MPSASDRTASLACAVTVRSSGWLSTPEREQALSAGFEPTTRRRIFCAMSRVPEAECLDEDIIAAFVDGQLSAQMVEAVDAHVASCR
ncbi:MAG TPA: hypothetical protein VMG12_13960, partial [Polyangiaceae bacterium]|nr:hypothetical protein [Polyangiaceae bacterium]